MQIPHLVLSLTQGEPYMNGSLSEKYLLKSATVRHDYIKDGIKGNTILYVSPTAKFSLLDWESVMKEMYALGVQV